MNRTGGATQSSIIFRWWKISLRSEYRSAKPGETKETHEDFLDNSHLQGPLQDFLMPESSAGDLSKSLLLPGPLSSTWVSYLALAGLELVMKEDQAGLKRINIHLPLLPIRVTGVCHHKQEIPRKKLCLKDLTAQNCSRWEVGMLQIQATSHLILD
ncbi:F-box only protein 36 isoform X4 [Arvicanthis niloticus]|uniref:F-box only protein 36 isoform X4 n=1 Tax=Arvicanthis niloticus TaxID=61156 RepID=UPI00402B76AB